MYKYCYSNEGAIYAKVYVDRDRLPSNTGIIWGPIWGSFAVLGSFVDPYVMTVLTIFFLG